MKVTSNDSTPNYLNQKVAVAGNLTKQVLNAGGNEQLEISGSALATKELDNLGVTAVNADIDPNNDANSQNARDIGNDSYRWRVIYGRQIQGIIKSVDSPGVGPALTGIVNSGSVDSDYSLAAKHYDATNTDGLYVARFCHSPSSSTKRRLLQLEQDTNYSDNDADAISYYRNGTDAEDELFQVCNKGWIGDRYSGYRGIGEGGVTSNSYIVTFANSLPDAEYTIALGADLYATFNSQSQQTRYWIVIVYVTNRTSSGFTLNWRFINRDSGAFQNPADFDQYENVSFTNAVI